MRVEASPAPPEELIAGLNDCGRAVLALLWDAEGPLSAEKVRDKLEAQGAVFGLITVQRALRLLHRTHKAVEHSGHRSRGDYLPLFRVKPRPDAGADNPRRRRVMAVPERLELFAIVGKARRS